jgi:hypothetical protein
MSGIGDMAKNALNSDKGEQVSDGALDKAGDAVDERTGGKHDEQVSKAEKTIDSKIGQ